MLKLLLVFLFCFNSYSQEVLHEEPVVFIDGGALPYYIPKGRENVSAKEKVVNFGAVYLTQWTVYYYTQEETIRNEGSFKNWYTNPFKPHYDKDSFDYNIIKHSLVGGYYYLFYRSRGYTEKNSFFWSFMSSLAFEFAVETATEKPSYQDIYQTPVFGAVVGICFEKASNYFHSWDTWYGKTLGYMINPMTLIPQLVKRDDVALVPMIDNKTVGAMATYRF
jgi:hypothetical protein